jgi:hypothetical protein
MDDLRLLIDKIRSLLDERAADPGDSVTELEHTLTDGYAAALELERERLRIERRMSELARTVDRPEEADELRGLAARLIGTEGKLSELRTLLDELRRLADSRTTA